MWSSLLVGASLLAGAFGDDVMSGFYRLEGTKKELAVCQYQATGMYYWALHNRHGNVLGVGNGMLSGSAVTGGGEGTGEVLLFECNDGCAVNADYTFELAISDDDVYSLVISDNMPIVTLTRKGGDKMPSAADCFMSYPNAETDYTSLDTKLFASDKIRGSGLSEIQLFKDGQILCWSFEKSNGNAVSGGMMANALRYVNSVGGLYATMDWTDDGLEESDPCHGGIEIQSYLAEDSYMIVWMCLDGSQPKQTTYEEYQIEVGDAECPLWESESD